VDAAKPAAGNSYPYPQERTVWLRQEMGGEAAGPSGSRPRPLS